MGIPFGLVNFSRGVPIIYFSGSQQKKTVKFPGIFQNKTTKFSNNFPVVNPRKVEFLREINFFKKFFQGVSTLFDKKYQS